MWILVLVFTYSKSITSEQISFETKTSCEAALEQIKSMDDYVKNITGRCVKK